MKRRRDIYADGGRREFEQARASRDVKIYLLTAAAAFGLPFIMAQCSSDDEPPAPQVASDQIYANNSFLPGAGYYHAPYHAWFPLPYNQHDARGWYRGGQWRAQPDDEDPNQVSFGGSGSHVGSSGFTNASRPTPEAAAKANRAASDYHASTIRRGGFGGSSRSLFS